MSIKRIVALIENKITAKTQTETIRHLKELLYTIRAQRHNFSHELQVVYGLLEVNAFEEAKNYIKNSMSEIAATSELVKTDNIEITALLYAKTGLAEARKIELQIEVKTSFKQPPFESRDINLILGNLIDNALEASLELLPGQRKVVVIFSQNNQGYLLEVRNNGSLIPTELMEQIFEPEFSTKGKGHGMGLYTVKKIVQKYHGTIQVSSDSCDTCFKILIPHK
jgi:two-component system sensor histidine kinase AgrC